MKKFNKKGFIDGESILGFVGFVVLILLIVNVFIPLFKTLFKVVPQRAIGVTCIGDVGFVSSSGDGYKIDGLDFETANNVFDFGDYTHDPNGEQYEIKSILIKLEVIAFVNSINELESRKPDRTREGRTVGNWID